LPVPLWPGVGHEDRRKPVGRDPTRGAERLGPIGRAERGNGAIPLPRQLSASARRTSIHQHRCTKPKLNRGSIRTLKCSARVPDLWGVEAMSDPYRESSLGIAREMAIFRGKLAGRMSEQTIVVEELEEQARGVLSREAFDYLAGGAGSEDSMRANLAAFKR